MVLQKHWPDVPKWRDVRDVTRESTGIFQPVLISGGFPCQDISYAGLGCGINGPKSGLWKEAVRVIKEISPKWVLCENVSALRTRGLPQVLCDLSEIGYDAEWYCYKASRFNAPHKRERILVVAHRNSEHGEEHIIRDQLDNASEEVSLGRGVYDPAWSENWREIATSLFRVDDGIPYRVDRGTALGNAVVPQQVYPILKAIADFERGVSLSLIHI